MATKKVRYRPISGYKYALQAMAWCLTGILGHAVATEYVSLDAQGRLTCRKGYAWDGASGPARDTPSFLRASLFHDALYQLMRMGLLPKSYRKAADKLMQQMCREDGMAEEKLWGWLPIGKARIHWVYWGVRLFGGAHNRKRRWRIL